MFFLFELAISADNLNSVFYVFQFIKIFIRIPHIFAKIQITFTYHVPTGRTLNNKNIFVLLFCVVFI